MESNKKITSFQIDIFTNGEEVYMLDDVLFNFKCRFIKNINDTFLPNDVLLIFSRHFDLPNILDLINRYNRIIIFERHEYVDEIRMKNTIMPILKNYKGNKTVISHMPNYHSLIKSGLMIILFIHFQLKHKFQFGEVSIIKKYNIMKTKIKQLKHI